METAAQGLLTRDEMESRRLMAAQDLQRGLTQSQVSRKFGVSRTTASRWHRALSGRGVESLRKRRAPGRPCRLTAQQLADVADLFRTGPRVAGFDSDRWTTMRFAEAIYVLHVFQKKSKRGIATPRRDINLIRQRLREAARIHAAREGLTR